MSEEKLNQLYQACLSDSSLESSMNLVEEFSSNLYSLLMNLDEKKLKIVSSILEDPFFLHNDVMQIRLLECLKYYQEKACYTVTRKDNPTVFDIQFIQFQLFSYQEIQQLLLKRTLDSFSDAIQIQIKKYLDSDIYFLYTQSLLHYLRTTFFDIDSSEIVRILNLVTNNENFHTAIKGKKLNLLQKGVVQNYIEDVIPIIEFVSDRYVQCDPLVESILSYKLQDKNIIKFFVRTLSLQRLIAIFCDASHLLDFISQIPYLTKIEKETLASEIFLKAKEEEDYDVLSQLYVHSYQNPDFQQIIRLNENDILAYIECYGITNPEVIHYFIDCDPSEQFVSNSMFLVKDFEFAKKALKTKILTKDMLETQITSADSLEQKTLKCRDYNLSGRVLVYSYAIEMLQEYFLGNLILNVDSMQAILRTILHEISNSIEAVLFMDSPTSSGSMGFSPVCYVKINNERIQDFLNPSYSWNQRIRLFQTLFHEFRHVIQPNSNFMSKDAFLSIFMEDMLLKYDLDYYKRNYNVTFFEEDANRFSNLYTWRFLRQFSLPFDVSYLLEDPTKKNDPKRVLSVSKNKVNVVQAFQKLMDFHPSVAHEYERYCTKVQKSSLIL